MKILIAGGCGYVGSYLIPLLLERGYELDNVHIGRETDLTLRIKHMGYKAATYKGDKYFPNGIDEFTCGYNKFYATDWYKNSTLEWEQ